MKILGIGNAIVDVICKVDENFIKQNNLTKGTMKLIFDDKEFKSMLSNLKNRKKNYFRWISSKFHSWTYLN